MREPKPFWRSSKQAWYLQINGRQRSLGKDKKKAWERYHQIMAEVEPIEPSKATVAELFEIYLDWVEQNRSDGGYQKVRRHLKHFSRHIGLSSKVVAISGADLTKWVESEKTWNSTTRNDAIGFGDAMLQLGC